MAFGRDGSELELSVYDLQNRIFRDALEKILRHSRDKEIKKIAEDALNHSEEISNRLTNNE